MEDPPAPKRQRRSEAGPAHSKKRACAPDNATPSKILKRSRKSANLLAEELLASGRPVTDDSILRVLRSWKFSENNNRVNVKGDAAFVLSDTLGLVSARTGVVSASRLTRGYPAVFKLMSYWVREAWPLSSNFPFTSVSVNFDYAAQRHRDGNNAGPSLTKAFGEFRGGSLRYWGEDDGCLSVGELGLFSATVLETGKALALFDGRRAHEVEPFSGERYSLVFFCTGSFTRARDDALSFLASLGANIPTFASLRQATRYLSPAKGYDLRDKQQRGILEVCGKEAKPTCVVWKTQCLLSMGSDCLDKCVSFFISPLLMSSLCAAAKTMSAACWRPSAWHGTTVDAAGCRPDGRLAMAHFKLWSSAKAVVAGTWERGNVSVLLDRTWLVWSFLHLGGVDVLVSRCPVPSNNVSVFFNAHRAADEGKVFVGISSTVSHHEIASALSGRSLAPGAFAVAAVLSNARCKAFRCNGKSFGPSAPPVRHLRGIVQFSLVDRCVMIEVPGRAPIVAKTPADVAIGNEYHCFVVMPPAFEPDSVRACWSRLSA